MEFKVCEDGLVQLARQLFQVEGYASEFGVCYFAGHGSGVVGSIELLLLGGVV